MSSIDSIIATWRSQTAAAWLLTQVKVHSYFHRRATYQLGLAFPRKKLREDTHQSLESGKRSILIYMI
jgi:hypothetical protein